MIDPAFRNIDRLFVLSFRNAHDNPTRNSFDKYYMPLVKIKDFHALIDNKPFFEHPVKNKQEAYEKLIEMSRNDDYAIGNLLDYLYHQNIANSFVQIYQDKQIQVFLNKLILYKK